jgi:hypothetical protein
MNFILITNTCWDEPPRIRHQLTRLLAENGHKVYFFQRPMLFNKATSEASICEVEKNIFLLPNKRYFHHRLSISYFNLLDQWLINRQIEAFLKKNNFEKIEFVLVNFIYDISVTIDGFLKKIVILNDDFAAQTAILGVEYKKYSINKNVSNSGALFATAPFLLEKHGLFTPQNKMLLPWVDKEEIACLSRRESDSKKTKFLYFGFVSKRVDWRLVKLLASIYPQYDFVFYGPVCGKIKIVVNEISAKHHNVIFKNTINFCDIPFSEFYASITPYRGGKGDENIYVTNKFFRLAAAGLPSINSGLPGFMKHRVIFNCATQQDFINSIKIVVDNFESLSEESKNLSKEHTFLSAYNNFIRFYDD